MKGVAEGAGVELLDILALNVRTEIIFGLFTDQPALPVKVDGCTSLAYHTAAGTGYLAQNWDWQVDQGPNLLVLYISQPEIDVPRFSMVTEAGVLGKIGFNEAGVGVCLNSIRVRGVERAKLPTHLALRTILELKSRDEAIEKLERLGVAGSAHILVADPTGATGLECTAKGIKHLEADKDGVIVHTNHLLLHHENVVEPPWLQDSPIRCQRMRHLLGETLSANQPIDAKSLFELFKDEDGHPGASNRSQNDGSEFGTLFNIIMDLPERKAFVVFGRPTDAGERHDIVL